MARRVLRGRDEELAVLEELCGRASRTGRGGVVIVLGEPGIGKTALLRAVTEQAERAGFAVGLGKAEELHQVAPGEPLLVALRSGTRPLLDADTFGSLAPLHQQPVWLVDRIASILAERAQQSPVLIAIDDVQWADSVTRFALQVLAGRLSGRPVVWFLTTRCADRNEFDTVGEDIDRHHIELGPLSDADLDRLAMDYLGGPVQGRTHGRLHTLGGNPFLAIQLLQGVSAARDAGADTDNLPATFAAAIDARLRSVSVGAAELIELAAVWGKALGLSEAADILDGLSGAMVTAWQAEAYSRGLLADDRDQIGFTHDLIREAVYDNMRIATRRALHRRCAKYLVASGQGAVAAAPHARAGATFGDRDMVEILRVAAAQTSHAVPEIAAPLILRAFELVDRHDPQWLEIGEQCAEILTRAQRCREAVAVVDALLVQATDADTRAGLESIAAQSLWLMGELDDIDRRVSQAAARSAVSPALRARLSAVGALVRSRLDTAKEAALAAESALTRGRALADIPTQVIALQALGETDTYEGRYASARSRYRALRALGGAAHLAGEIAALQHIDRFDEADELLIQGRRTDGDRTDHILPSLVVAQLWQDYKLGRFDDAENAAHTLLRMCDELGSYVHKLDAWLVGSAIAVIRGDLPLARERLRPAEATGRADDAVRTPCLFLVKGRIAAAEGHPETCVRIVKPLMASLAQSRSWWPRSPEILRIHAGAAVALGDDEFARQTVDYARVSVERNPGVGSFEGLALQVEGFVSGEVVLLRDAVKVLRESPRPMLLAGALADFGAALVKLGDRAAGTEALLEAHDIYAGLGATLFLSAIERDLRSAGATADGAAAHPSVVVARRSLTAAEERVALLVSEGHTNQSAASALGVSIHTVNTHLRGVFRKMNVQSRVQLANAMRAQGGRHR